MFRCPECNSSAVFQYISIGAKERLNAKSDKRLVFGINPDDKDNIFETCGCTKCGWEGDFYGLKK